MFRYIQVNKIEKNKVIEIFDNKMISQQINIDTV